MAEKNLTLDWYPVGTGPYMLTENNPEPSAWCSSAIRTSTAKCIQAKASRQTPRDGLLADAGKPLPFIDKVVFSLEKESDPVLEQVSAGLLRRLRHRARTTSTRRCRWSATGDADAHDGDGGSKGIRLPTSVETSIVVHRRSTCSIRSSAGGDRPASARASCGRRISIAHRPGRAHLDLPQRAAALRRKDRSPPAIFGYREGEAGIQSGSLRLGRRPAAAQVDRGGAEAARRGRLSRTAATPKTGQPLVALFRHTRGAGRQGAARLVSKQFAKIDVQLVVRATDYNRFQDKMRKGTTQLFSWGWNADYPDPENFLFLLHGQQSKVKYAGRERMRTTQNPAFDRPVRADENMPNGPERQAVINEMVEIAAHDAPWVWGCIPRTTALRTSMGLERQAEEDGAQQHEVPAGSIRSCATRCAPNGTGRSCWPLGHRC